MVSKDGQQLHLFLAENTFVEGGTRGLSLCAAAAQLSAFFQQPVGRRFGEHASFCLSGLENQYTQAQTAGEMQLQDDKQDRRCGRW